MVVISRGIDTIVLTWEAPVAPDAREELAHLRDLSRERRETKDATPTVWHALGMTFEVGTAKGPFRYLLTSRDAMTVAVMGANLAGTPTVKAELRAQFLWTLGYRAAVERARQLVGCLVTGKDGPPDRDLDLGVERVFRVDLAVDFQGWGFDGLDGEYDRWRCVAHNKHATHGPRGTAKFTGYSFGLGGDTGFRVYDKTQEIGEQESEAHRKRVRLEGHKAWMAKRPARDVKRMPGKKAWFPTVWEAQARALGVPYDRAATVWRAEAQLRGEALKQLGVRRDFLEVFATKADGVWRSVVGAPTWRPERGERGKAWLSFREPSPPLDWHPPRRLPDRTRAPIDRRWRELQRVVFVSEAAPAVRERAREISEERLVVGMRGYAVSYAAHKGLPLGLGVTSGAVITRTLDDLRAALLSRDATEDRSFMARTVDKRALMDSSGGSVCAVCEARATRRARRVGPFHAPADGIGSIQLWAVCDDGDCRAQVEADEERQRDDLAGPIRFKVRARRADLIEDYRRKKAEEDESAARAERWFIRECEKQNSHGS